MKRITALVVGLAGGALLSIGLAHAAVPAGDPARGKIAYQKCFACHSLAARENVSGPSLDRIIGRRIAADPTFEYSNSLRSLARRSGRWDERLLDRFITDPEALAPRTAMTFTGIRDAKERADLLAYLRQQDRKSWAR